MWDGTPAIWDPTAVPYEMKPRLVVGYFSVEVRSDDASAINRAIVAIVGRPELINTNVIGDVTFMTYEKKGTSNSVEAVKKGVRRLSRGKPRFDVLGFTFEGPSTIEERSFLRRYYSGELGANVSGTTREARTLTAADFYRVTD